MITFTPRPCEPEREEQAGIAWLQETLSRLAPERGMPAGSRWEIAVGVREAAVANGPRLRQTGYQVTALDPAGQPYLPTFFIALEEAIEEELQPSVEQVLELWLDRLSVSPAG
jgi:hypothetical protein